MKKCFIIFLFFFVSLGFAEDKEPYCQDPETNAQVERKFESGFEYMGQGAVEVTAGVLSFPAHPLGSSFIIMDGARRIKDGIYEYKDAYDLIERDRQMHEVQDRGMEPSGPDLSDRN